MATKKTLEIDDELVKDIQNIAESENTTFTKVTHDALRFYRDRNYMENKATVISEDITQSFKASIALMEARLNNKSNQLLSCLAIQQFIQTMLLTDNLEDISHEQIEVYRKAAVEFLQANQRVLRFDEVAQDD